MPRSPRVLIAQSSPAQSNNPAPKAELKYILARRSAEHFSKNISRFAERKDGVTKMLPPVSVTHPERA